jgi:tryptophan synthase alpha chain
MVSYSIVHRRGLGDFMTEAVSAGFDGVILPDVPAEESALTAEAADRAGLCHIGLVAPTTSAARRAQIAKCATGFIYQIAAAGTTGERSDLPPELPERVSELRRLSNLPVCVGFGVSRPEQARAVCGFADGAIVGSAIIRRMTDAIERDTPREAIVEAVSGFLGLLLTG